VAVGDELVAPFEGAGAISDWQLELPASNGFDFGTITDVIVRLVVHRLLGGVAHPLEPVEDEVETELELARLVRVRLVEVLLRVLDHVRVVVDRDLLEELARHVDQLLAVLEGEAHLPEREARDVRVERVVGVVRQVR
jgi:hypothetical protein